MRSAGRDREIRIQQGQQGSECIFFTAVRGGRDQNDVTVGVSGEAGNKLVALMPMGTPLSAPRTRVGLIDDDEFGTRPQKLVAAAVRFDEVKGDDDEGMVLEQGFSQRQATLQPGCRARKHQFRVDVELVAKLSLPLLGQLRRAEDREARHFATVEQFSGDERSFDRLADTDVVGNQDADGIELQRHQQWHELVGPWLDCQVSKRAKGAGTRPEAKPERVAKQAARSEIAQTGGVRQRRSGRAPPAQAARKSR